MPEMHPSGSWFWYYKFLRLCDAGCVRVSLWWKDAWGSADCNSVPLSIHSLLCKYLLSLLTHRNLWIHLSRAPRRQPFYFSFYKIFSFTFILMYSVYRFILFWMEGVFIILLCGLLFSIYCIQTYSILTHIFWWLIDFEYACWIQYCMINWTQFLN